MMNKFFFQLLACFSSNRLLNIVVLGRDYNILRSSISLARGWICIATKGEEIATKLDFINHATFMYQNDLAIIPNSFITIPIFN